jgi:hypothetical protein
MAVSLQKSGDFRLSRNLQLTQQQKHNLRNRVQALGETEPHYLRFFSDHDHGWLEVSVYKLSTLDLCLNDFSEYSFTNGRSQGEGKPFEWFRWSHGPMNDVGVTALIPEQRGYPFHVYYLEEDCDAGIYLKRHNDVYQRMPIIQTIYLPRDSGIRDLPYLHPRGDSR